MLPADRYGNPHTLSDTGVKLKVPESMGDLAVARPHFVIFAPAVLEKIYSGLNAKFQDGVLGKVRVDAVTVRLVWYASMQSHEGILG